MGTDPRFRRVEPIYRHFRTRRMAAFAERFALTPETTVLDVGGTPFNWKLIAVRPRITLLNLVGRGPTEPEVGMTYVEGDGRGLPFEDRSFDIVYSSSVIEHLGDQPSQQRFADEIRRVGRAYYVQTPNRWFPVEPHFMAPVIHWLPKPWRRKIARRFTGWGWLTRPSPERVVEHVDEFNLLDERVLRHLFPDGEIERERFLGMTKSLIITRQD